LWFSWLVILKKTSPLIFWEFWRNIIATQ
jgi:hypothetical protein